MQVRHPDGRKLIFMRQETHIMAELEIKGPGWVTFGCVGGDETLLVDCDEWDGFVAMVKEIDEARSGRDNKGQAMSEADPRGVYIPCGSGNNPFTDVLVIPYGDLVRLIGHAQMDLIPADAVRLGQVLLAHARALGWREPAE